MAEFLKTVAGAVRRHPMLARMALGVIPDWHVNVAVPEIGNMRIRMRRNRSFWLRSPLSMEWYPLAMLKAFVTPASVVWDVGANIGLYSRWLASRLGAGRVVAFEPMSQNLPELRHNIEIGGLTGRVTVVPWALSNRDGELDFQIDDVQSASGSIDLVRQGKASAGRQALRLPPKTEKVQSRSIDSILGSKELPVPDVLKVDVEGAESLVLEGGDRFLSSHSPLLVIETHGIEAAQSCLRFLFDRGYAAAGCVPADWNAGRHMRLDRSVIGRIRDQYDVHFIAAAKDAGRIPPALTYERH